MCKKYQAYGRKGKTWSGLETSRRIKLFSWRRMKKIRSVLTSNTSNSAKLKSDAPINNPNKPPAFASISIKLWDSERFCGMNCSSVKDITTRLKVELKIEKNYSLKIFLKNNFNKNFTFHNQNHEDILMKNRIQQDCKPPEWHRCRMLMLRFALRYINL